VKHVRARVVNASSPRSITDAVSLTVEHRRKAIVGFVYVCCVAGSCAKPAEPALEIPSWAVVDTPWITVGEGKADSSAFKFVRDARFFTSDSTLLVMDGGTLRLNTYDARSGKLLFSVGGPGRGPREFESLYGTALDADTLWILDINGGRISVWLRGREPLRVEPIPTTDQVQVASWLQLSAAQVLYRQSKVRCKTQGQMADSVTLFIASPNGSTRRLGRFHGGQVFSDLNFMGKGCLTITGAFGVPPAALESGRAVWLLEGELGNLYKIPLDGGDYIKVPFQVNARALTPADRKSFEDSFLVAAGEDFKAASAAQLRQMQFPKTLPAFSALAPSADGGVWVGEWVRSSDSTRAWYVVSRDGQVRARVRLPRRLDVIDAGDGYVVTRSITQDERPIVRVYSIKK
jgi:hypothetical protein